MRPLSPAEREKAGAYREQAARKLKMARLLGEGGLPEEARPALVESVLLLGRALAVEHRLPEPDSAVAALLPPLSLCWQESLMAARSYLEDAASPWAPLAEMLARRLEAPRGGVPHPPPG